LAVKIRVSDARDNTPRRDHVIAVCNKFDLIFVGVGNGNLFIPFVNRLQCSVEDL